MSQNKPYRTNERCGKFKVSNNSADILETTRTVFTKLRLFPPCPGLNNTAYHLLLCPSETSETQKAVKFECSPHAEIIWNATSYRPHKLKAIINVFFLCVCVRANQIIFHTFQENHPPRNTINVAKTQTFSPRFFEGSGAAVHRLWCYLCHENVFNSQHRFDSNQTHF